MWRKYFAVCVVASLFFWVFFGFDSVWAQLEPLINGMVPLILGKTTLSTVLEETRVMYGLGNHFSAPVIYGTAFVVLSIHFERKGIVKSLNFFCSTALSLMNIGVFELIWNPLFAYYQNQVWVITFKWLQLGNLLFFSLFIIFGLLSLVYLWPDGYRPNISRRTLIFLVLSISIWTFWINYPFQTETIYVETTAGTWSNTQKFPQTYYVIDMDPLDDYAMGLPHHADNNGVHLVNLLAKVFTTLTLLSYSMVRRTQI